MNSRIVAVRVRALHLLTGSALGALAFGGVASAQVAPGTAAAAPVETGTETPLPQGGLAPQTTDATDAPDIVVTGIRASLASSVATKRNAANVVDSISAEDAGKFPEVNVAESLQRVPGIQVVRNFGLGQQVAARGLGPDFTNVLLNGRTLPSDTGAWSADGGGRGRSFNFDVLPSDMISRIDVNKTMMPGITEGGIGATVNILTPRPLNIGKTYGSLSASGYVVSRVNTVRPNVSGLYSWVNDAGTLGVMVSGSYVDFRASRDYTRINQWDARDLNVVRGTAASPTVTTENRWAPRQISYGNVGGGTQRYFGSTAVQYKPTDKLVLTVDGFYTRLDQKISDSIVNLVFGNTLVNPQFDSTGVLTSGTYPGQAFLQSPAVRAALGTREVSQPQNLSVIRARDRLAESYDVGFNAQWDPTETLSITADVAHGRSTGDKRFDPYALIGNNAASDVTYGYADNNPTVRTVDTVFTDPSRVRLGYAGNWGQTMDDRLTEVQLTTRWRPDGAFLRSVGVGIDYQDRTKGQDNFSSRSSPYDTLTFPVDPALLRPMTFGNDFLKGKVQSPTTNFFGYDPRQLFEWMSSPAQLNRRGQFSSTYLPTTGADGTVTCTGNCALIASDPKIPGGPLALAFDPGGSFSTAEKASAGFADLGFGTGGLSGNAGVRVVHVSTESTGYGQSVTSITRSTTGAGGAPTYVFTYGTPGQLSQDASYTAVLPSANLRYDLTPNLVVRGAASRALTRADLNDLRYGQYWGDGRDGRLTLGLGNPGLKPQYANNYDLSLEWYLSNVNYISVAGFRKDLSNLFQSVTLTNQQVSPAPDPVAVTQTVNLAKGRVDGVEVAAQYTLDERFGIFNGFGATGNYTHVNARVRDDSVGSCGFTGISPNSYNVSGFYDNGKLEARVSYNWRSAWTMACNWAGDGVDQKHAAYGQMDIALRYNFNPTLQLFADITNVTDADNFIYAGTQNRFVERSVDYRRVNAGARLRF